MREWFRQIRDIVKRVLKRLKWKGVSVYLVVKILADGVFNGFVTLRAAAISFSMFLAIFPFIIFLFTIIPYLPFEGLQDRLLFFVFELLPPALLGSVQDTLIDIVSIKHSGLVSIGFVSALLLATNGINALLSAFASTYHQNQLIIANTFKQYLTALVLTFLLTISLFVIVGAVVTHEVLINLLDAKLESNRLILLFSKLVQIAFPLLLIYFNTCLMYYSIQRSNPNWRFFSLGAWVTTLMVIGTSYLFQVYMNSFSNYNKLYGSIGVLLAFMFWIYLNAIALIVGFEVNVSVFLAKKKKNVEEG